MNTLLLLPLLPFDILDFMEWGLGGLWVVFYVGGNCFLYLSLSVYAIAELMTDFGAGTYMCWVNLFFLVLCRFGGLHLIFLVRVRGVCIFL